MPFYSAFNEDGEYREAFFKMGDAPGIGEIFDYEGESLRRVPDLPGVQMGFKPFVSHQLAPNHPGASKYDREGRPAFDTERDVREFLARNNDSGGKYQKLNWDE